MLDFLLFLQKTDIGTVYLFFRPNRPFETMRGLCIMDLSAGAHYGFAGTLQHMCSLQSAVIRFILLDLLVKLVANGLSCCAAFQPRFGGFKL